MDDCQMDHPEGSFELPEGSHQLPDPDTAPDGWTRGAFELANEAILTGTCPSCGGTPDHQAVCPALTANIERHALKHGLSLAGMMTALYVKRDDGGHMKLLSIMPYLGS
jgi:hypothetical protein